MKWSCRHPHAHAHSRLGLAALCLALFLGALPSHAQPRDPEGWLEIETANFRLLTDASSEKGAEVALRLEEFRATFARLAPSLELRSPAPTLLFAFRNAASYAPYKSRPDRGSSRVLGQFSRTRDGNFLTIDTSSELADAFSVIFHEYVHFLVVHNFPRVPLWFNEGLAEYYSTFEIEGEGHRRRAILGDPVARHQRLLGRDGDFDLSEIIAADTRSSAYHDPDETGRFYALSWALVHYLMSGGSAEMDRTVDYFLRLREGEDPERAFEGAFGRYLSTMEDELRTYMQTDNFATLAVPLPAIDRGGVQVRRLPAADVLVHLGNLQLRLGRSGAAESHFYEALERNPRHADAHAGLAHVRDLSDRWPEAETLYRDAVRLRSRSATTYLHYGRHSLAIGPLAEPKDRAAAEDRARQSLETAVALDPDFGEAHALLALAHSRSGGDLDRALESVRRAGDLLPQRLDLVALEIRILLRQEKPGLAQKILDRRLRPFENEDPDLIFEVQEDIDRTHLVLSAQKALTAGEVEKGLILFDQAVALTSNPALRERMEQQLLELQKLHAPGDRE